MRLFYVLKTEQYLSEQMRLCMRLCWDPWSQHPNLHTQTGLIIVDGGREMFTKEPKQEGENKGPSTKA